MPGKKSVSSRIPDHLLNDAPKRPAQRAEEFAHRYKPGDQVAFTGVFLKATGQIAGGEGQRWFLVVDHPNCALCRRGVFVAVDDWSASDPTHVRHILAINLYRRGELTTRNCP